MIFSALSEPRRSTDPPRNPILTTIRVVHPDQRRAGTDTGPTRGARRRSSGLPREDNFLAGKNPAAKNSPANRIEAHGGPFP